MRGEEGGREREREGDASVVSHLEKAQCLGKWERGILGNGVRSGAAETHSERDGGGVRWRGRSFHTGGGEDTGEGAQRRILHFLVSHNALGWEVATGQPIVDELQCVCVCVCECAQTFCVCGCVSV